MELRTILEDIAAGRLSVTEAEHIIQQNSYEELGYAKIDCGRKARSGHSEVVFCQGKPDEYITEIYRNIYNNDGEVLGTRASGHQYDIVRGSLPDVQYNDISRILKIEKEKEKNGNIVICTGGTSDIPIAEEAAETAEFMGSNVTRIYDVGVAGIHRLLSKQDILSKANVIIAIAGMEGALASVVAGLVSVPVIAVPTSIGYGASFGGLAALLGMLNSCSNSVSVVNIDNGYGAGYIANMINQAVTHR